MKLTEKQLKLIELYFNGNLTAEQEKDFQANLQFEEFRNQLLFQAKLLDAQSNLHKGDLIRQIKGEQEGLKSVKEGRSLYMNIIKVAAIGVILLGAFFLFQNITDSNSSNLYAESFKPYPADVQTRGNDNVVQTTEYKNAMKLYSIGNYRGAYDKLKRLPESDMLNLYKGICLMNLDQEEEASQLFSLLKNASTKELRDNAKWYQALSLLKSKRIREAKSILIQLVDDEENIFFRQAQRLLAKL